jgi:ribonucleoside-diphosphate reductase alpha chain
LKVNFSDKDRESIIEEVSNNRGSCQKCKKIPQEMKDIFIVAGDMTPQEHLSILEAVANNVSLSVSKTLNLPKDCSKEEISKVFIDAHKRGVIGVTCYRDGSREGILLHKDEDKAVFVERHAPKRPKELPCHVYRLTVKGEKWIVFMGIFQNRPFELFAGRVKLVDIPSSITEGILVKTDSCVYQFVYNEEVIIADISKLFDCGEQESITRLISTALRHGVPINFINEQLSKSYGTIVDFNKAILRSFKRYLKNEETGEVCDICGAKLMYIEGCKRCSDPECSFAKCG